MKKLFFLILLIIPFNVMALSASSAIVMDSDTNRVLYTHNAYEPKLIASTTKIMTAIIALENSKLNTKITVDENVLKAYGSAIYIKVGEELTIKDLLYGLMLRSGNDAAIVLASSVCKTQEEFVSLMNKKAMQLGMKNTIFYNPHGLEEENGNANTSTAYDMALLMSYALKNKKFVKITSALEYRLTTNMNTYIWYNKNKLLKNYEYCTGGKTGFTQKARRTLVTSASKDKKNLVIVTLNDPNDFTDHQNLYEEIFEKYDLVTIINKKKYKIKDKNYKGNKLYLKNDVKLLLTSEEKKKIKIKIKLSKKSKNKIVGTLNVYLNNNLLKKENIYIK